MFRPDRLTFARTVNDPDERTIHATTEPGDVHELLREFGADVEKLVTMAYRRAFSRSPTADEVKVAKEFLKAQKRNWPGTAIVASAGGSA